MHKKINFKKNKSNTCLLLLLFFSWVVAAFFIIPEKSNRAVMFTFFIFVSVGGITASRNILQSCKDANLNIIQYLWLLKLNFTVFLVFFVYAKSLDPSSVFWGSDPTRYYLDAWETINNNWSPVSTWDGITFQDGGANYAGLLYYYGAVFFLFGHNPLVPALINCFLTFLGTLFLVRYCYFLVPLSSKKRFLIAYTLIIPELVWYDIMTSRETILSVCLTITIISAGNLICGIRNIQPWGNWILYIIGNLSILAIRGSMIIPIFLATVLYFFLCPKNKNNFLRNCSIISFQLIAFFAAPMIQSFLGGTGLDYNLLQENLTIAESNSASRSDNWSEKSIGRLLLPSGLFQSIIFVPFRIILYLAAPLPTVLTNPINLLKGFPFAWENLLMALSAFLNLMVFPYVLSSFSLAFRNRKKNPSLLIIPIAFLVVLVAIAGGNMFIHERYRVMSSLLLFACAWIGFTIGIKSDVYFWFFSWYLIVLLSGCFYIFFKTFVYYV